ncbi:MAG TPA: hypothetical protein VM736_05530 [Gemmatimonadales bacterium]|nr:hypothetical protein [Gemmatimonadales bacterium]
MPRLAISRVNPLEHAEEIKQLFLAEERPEFPEFFDRAYRDAVAAGGMSWIGRDEWGTVRSHIALFPHQFLLAGRVVRGSLLANLMVAKSHRAFWPAHALVRRAVQDSKASRSVDFLYADPNEPARAITHAAGFRSVAELRRFVLPLTDRRRSIDLVIRLYLLIGRLRARATPLEVTAWGDREPPALPDHPTHARDARFLRPVRGAGLYRARLPGYPGPTDCWYTVHARDLPVANALVRGPERPGGQAVICALECQSTPLVSSVLLSLACRLQRAGVPRLEAWVTVDSRAATEARRVGFVPRHDRIPLMALPITELGAEAIAAAPEWRLVLIDLDR